MSDVRILLVDDHRMMLSGLRMVLARQPGITVVGEATNGATALQMSRALRPGLVVMDVHLPDMNGVEAARSILAESPEVRILVLSADFSAAVVDAALAAGVHGYLLKENAPDELMRAIGMILEGRLYLSPEATASILTEYRRELRGGGGTAHSPLSEREQQVLRLLAEGLRNREIAERLGVSVKTVETYRRRLMQKLGCASLADLIRYAVREKLVAP